MIEWESMIESGARITKTHYIIVVVVTIHSARFFWESRWMWNVVVEITTAITTTTVEMTRQISLNES